MSRYVAGYYDRQGLPMSLEQWTERLGDHDYRRVAVDTVGSYRVSTVWLGLDHSFGDSDRPLIFETMIFSPHSALDLDCRRYATEEQALAGHAEAVTLLRATAQNLEDLTGGDTSDLDTSL